MRSANDVIHDIPMRAPRKDGNYKETLCENNLKGL